MKIIEPKVELWQQGDDAKAHVARCARVCYGRETGNDEATIKRLINDECKAIRDCGGMIIRVDRKSNNDNHDSHESEQITINKDDYVIDNTGTLVGLFYKVLKFVTDYMV
jgi:hypothetical protein